MVMGGACCTHVKNEVTGARVMAAGTEVITLVTADGVNVDIIGGGVTKDVSLM
jgi:hypothetical protein